MPESTERQTVRMLKMKSSKILPLLVISAVTATVLAFLAFSAVYDWYISYTDSRDTAEGLENYFLSQTYRAEGSDYRFKLYEKPNDRYVIVLQSQNNASTDEIPEKIRYYASSETVFFDNEQMQNTANREKAADTVIPLTEVTNEYVQNMDDEDCGMKCRTVFRNYLKSVKIRIEDNELIYTGIQTFSLLKKRYERQKSVTLGNQEIFSNSHMLKDTSTGNLIIPDETFGGCYRQLDIQTGKPIGEIISPCMRAPR